MHRAQLVRVALQVEQLPLRLLGAAGVAFDGERVGVVVDQLVGVGAHPVVRPHVVVRAVHPVAVVHGGAPVRGRGALQQRAERAALHVVGNRHPRVIEKGLREVDVEDHVGVDGARPHRARVAHDERHAQRLLVHEALVVPAVVAEKEPLVGGVDDDGVVGDPLGVEVVQQPPDALVDRVHAAQVVLDVALVEPALALGGRGEPHRLAAGGGEGIGTGAEAALRMAGIGRRDLHVAGHEVAFDPHLGGRRGARPVRVVVVEGLRVGDLLVRVAVRVPRMRVPRPVRRLVVAHQQERP